jgi:predicted RNA-binding protein with PUA-like domain
MKSEENEYSIDDLKRDKKVAWFGVRNYQARNFMRDHMHVGDLVLFYHSNGRPSGVVGVGKICSKSYPDKTQFDHTSPYFDKKATEEKPIWMLVDVHYVKKYTKIISLEELRTHGALQNMVLLQKGSRLSVIHVLQKDFNYIEKLAQT